MPVFVGCDMGTMVTKAAVVDEEGQILAEASAETALRTPRPGWVEQDLAEIEESAYATIRTAVQTSGRRRDVAGVAFSSQMSGIGTIDRHFRPATHFDSWLDSRCAPYITQMSEHADRVMELSGCPPTYSHGPKILWWRSERPEDYRRIARFVVPGAYVAGRLCGLRIDEAFIDRTYIHFSNLSDTAHSRWASELLDAFNVDRRLLPRIVDPLDIIGEVTQEGEEATGIPVGVPVAAGAGDQTAAALGAGVVTPGQAFDSAGTASAFAICVDSFAPDVEGKAVLASHSVLPGVFISLAFINGGGLALRWFRDEVMTNLSGEKDAYEQLNELAADVEPGAGGLLWIPHIQGEVLPPRPYVRGGWVGMTSGHTRAHMFRAILEGIALQYGEWSQTVSESFGGEGLREARVLGGGARSRLWNSIKADVVGATWTPMLRQECGVLGDALIAAGATGHIKDLAAAVNGWQETGKGISPDPVRHARYQQLLLIYRQLVEQMQPVFKQLEVWDQEN